MKNVRLAQLLLRVGLASTFLYVAIAGTLHPESWVGYFPAFVRSIIPNTKILLGSFSLFEFLLSFWLLTEWETVYAALVAAALLAAITLFNYQLIDVLFRNIGLFFAACALAALTAGKKK